MTLNSNPTPNDAVHEKREKTVTIFDNPNPHSSPAKTEESGIKYIAGKSNM